MGQSIQKLEFTDNNLKILSGLITLYLEKRKSQSFTPYFLFGNNFKLSEEMPT